MYAAVVLKLIQDVQPFLLLYRLLTQESLFYELMATEELSAPRSDFLEPGKTTGQLPLSKCGSH